MWSGFDVNAQKIVTTVAGGYVGDGKAATAAVLQNPQFAAMDGAGNLYVTDFRAHRIRKISTTGIITTVAGTGFAGFSGDGVSAKSAQISLPTGIVVDPNENIIFSDSGNNRIRKISRTGTITTVAGTGVAAFGGDGGPATEAKVKQPFGLSLDSAGNLFFSDRGNQRIRKIDTLGNIHTVAGNGKAAFSGNGGPATSASLNNPDSVYPGSNGVLYIADTQNFRVRKVDSTGTITTFAGGGSNGCKTVGPATSAILGPVTHVTERSGNLVISNAGCDFIRQVNLATNVISTVAGGTTINGSGGFDGNGHTALSSLFLVPTGILYDKVGNLLIVDSFNDQVRKVDAQTKIVKALAGGYIGDGQLGTAAALNLPQDIAFDTNGNMYIADSLGNRIRKLSPTGTISTVAGTGVSGRKGDGGPAKTATLWSPTAVTTDGKGNLFIADLFGSILRKVDAAGVITTLVSQNENFFSLVSMTSDSVGNIYAADSSACVVWKITPAGSISAVAGVSGSCAYDSDGIPATSALLSAPYGVAFDKSWNLYIGDSGNNRVRKVDTNGIISTVAGNGICGFSGNGGAATAAKLCSPSGVAFDSKGNLYIADFSNRRVRIVNSAGIISGLAGTGKTGYNGDGLPATKTNLDAPSALRVSPSGTVYVDDVLQYRVRKIQ